mgnify:CR=1 FL=1
MASKVSYKESVAGDLRRLDKSTARRILDKLERTLSANPDAGIPLTGEFRGLFRYRIGDYRVIYTKAPDGILVLRLRHRKDAYR